jgi:phospholipid/cholesterol/gamma-HCH transport system substrate-binding protein
MRDEVKAGIVIVGSLLVLAGLIVGVSGVSLWERYDTYTVRLRSSGGVDQGAAVRLGGLKVGTVLDMRIPPEDASRVEITLGVHRGTPIPQGTWATVATLGLLGDAFLQLTTDAHTDQRIPPGSQIPSREAATIADLLQRLQGVVSRADAVLNQVGATMGEDVGPLLKRVQGVATTTETALSQLEAFASPANRQRVEHILAALDQAVTESAGLLRQALEQFGAAARRADGTVAQVHDLVAENRADVRETVQILKTEAAQVETVLGRLERALGEAQAILAGARQVLSRVDATVADNREGLDETMADLQRSTHNLRELTQQLKERPWSLLAPAPVPEKPGLEPPPGKEPRR